MGSYLDQVLDNLPNIIDNDKGDDEYDPFKVEIVNTSRGSRFMCYGGYIYCVNKASKHSLYWNCRERVLGCQGKVRSSLQCTNIRDINYHNHAPSPAEIKEVKANARIKEKATEFCGTKKGSWTRTLNYTFMESNASLTTSGTTPAVAVEELNPPFDASQTVPEEEEFPLEPKVLEELNIEGIWAVTQAFTPKRFLLYDNKADGNKRLIVFSSDENLGFLAGRTTMFVDISYSLAPTIFKQITVIQTLLGSDVIPLVYAFSSGDKAEMYEELFTVILSKCEALNLSLLNINEFVIGYNVDCYNVVKRLFGNDIVVRGRFYHLSQLIWHRIQEVELTALCQESELFRLICCELVALAFLPVNEVWNGMLHIKDTLLNEFALRENAYKENVQSLVAFFDQLFISGEIKAKQKINGDLELHQIPPLFPIESWNLFEKVLTDDPKENNVLETCATNFSYLVGQTKPAVFKAIRNLKLEENLVSEKIKSFNKGYLPPRRVRKNLIEGHQKLARLCTQYASNEMSMDVFLMNVARNIRIGDW